jgi:hypothetical protein
LIQDFGEWDRQEYSTESDLTFSLVGLQELPHLLSLALDLLVIVSTPTLQNCQMILISWNWQFCLNPTQSPQSLDLYVEAVAYLQPVSACKQDLPCLILQEWKSFDQDATLVGH